MREARTTEVLLGVDTGGTFTDFVLLRRDAITVHKVPSTPDDPARAILQGIAQLGLTDALRAGELRIVHGSTVATNAVLEGKLARTLYITNRGFEDVPELARQARTELYALQPSAEDALVSRELRVGTGGRLAANGDVLEPLTRADLDALIATAKVSGAQAAAINLLYSFVDPRFEIDIERTLAASLFVSRSSFVLPEYREYERGVATYLNAALGPNIAGYLTRLQGAAAPSRVAVMMSSGGIIAAEQAAQRAVSLLLSGPAGGLVAASVLAQQRRNLRLLTFDMGGTSTDVALVDTSQDRGLRLTQSGQIGPWPIAIAMADIHTIGAGGGSLARVDEGGLLQVGPESAGAVPGPACYARGGMLPTVTDANLALGRLLPDAFLGGGMRLDRAAAQRAVESIAGPLGLSVTDAALGIIRVANEHMVQALRAISVERGEDPRLFSLCCYGGAGGLHVCALADALGIRSILLPNHGAVFSALGMVRARPARHLSRSVRTLLADSAMTLATVRVELELAARAELIAEGWTTSQIELSSGVDLRYRGQSYWLNLPTEREETIANLAARFDAEHASRYGHRIDTDIELVNVRVAAQGPQPRDVQVSADAKIHSHPPSAAALRAAAIDADDDNPRNPGLPVLARDAMTPGNAIDGVLLLTEPYTTTLIEDGWRAEVDRDGCLLLQRVT